MTIFSVHSPDFPYIFGVFRLFSVFLTLPLLCHSSYTSTTVSRILSLTSVRRFCIFELAGCLRNLSLRRISLMNTDYIFLNPAPMPYLTDCDYKKFEPNEYHISRIVDFFVLIFMLRGSLHFIEDDVSVSVQEGEWYIQRKICCRARIVPATVQSIITSISRRIIRRICSIESSCRSAEPFLHRCYFRL